VPDLHDLSARQEALETANETLHEVFKTVDGDAHQALTVAKQNIKLIIALRGTQLAHGEVIAGLVTEVADLKVEVADVKTEIAELKVEVGELKVEVGELKAEVLTGVTDVKADVGELKVGVAEVLRRLPA
jgi:phage shock protein A